MLQKIKNVFRANSLAEELRMTNEANNILKQHLSEFNLKAYEDGLHLSEQPFIPEYLGFAETVLEDPKLDTVVARIYTRDGWNIARPVSAICEWYVIVPDKYKVVVKLENMLHAIIILNSLGLDCNVADYMAGKYSLENLDNL